MEVSYEKRFFFKDGSSAGSLEELYKKIEEMSYDEFYEHVNNEKNDFANWIENVLGYKELADKMRLVTSMVETSELIYEQMHPDKEENLQKDIEEELFGELEKIHEDIQQEYPQEENESDKEDALPIRRPEAPKPYDEPELDIHHDKREIESDELVRFHKEVSSFMVKEFIYGLLFGLVLGFIIARIIGIVG